MVFALAQSQEGCGVAFGEMSLTLEFSVSLY